MFRGIVDNVLSGMKAGFKTILNLEHPFEREKMFNLKSSSKLSATLLVLIMGASVFMAGQVWAAKYVTDPTTGKVVTAPQYGGSLTVADRDDPDNIDTYYRHPPASVAALVVEKLGIGDWGVSRDKFDFRTTYLPDDIIVGRLAERWEQPDPTTIVFHIRQGVNWHNKAPMNGRALTAKDVEFNFHRFLGLGSGFTKVPEGVAAVASVDNLGITSVTARGNTVVFKLEKLNLSALKTILTQNVLFVYPPEVIKAGTGIDIGDWRNLVGTGPYELIRWVEGSTITWHKVPNYWGFDEKFPENRLPYIDTVTALVMPQPQTRLAALRSGKLDFIGFHEGAQLTSIDQVESLKRTNPEIVTQGYSYRSETSPVVNTTRAPFSDERVRHALQMALDIEGWGNAYFKGYAVTQPQGWMGRNLYPYMNRYEDWPEDIKQYYRYNPKGAEKLLDEAGHPRGSDGTRFKMEVISPPTFGDQGWNELLAAGWREIGIDVTITYLEGAVVNARHAAKDFDVRMAVSGYEWNPIGQLLHHVSFGGGWTAGHYNDPTYDEMVRTVQAATTLEELQRLSREASDYLNRKHVAIWGARVPQFNAHWPWVKGYNGEADPGDMDRSLIYSRLWIDPDLKKEMGF